MLLKKISTFFALVIGIFLFSNIYGGENDSSILENIFQEFIDENFEPVDERVLEYLTNLNQNKNYCFGKDRQMNFIECSDFIEKVFSINSEEFVMGEDGYAKACEKSLVETIYKTEEKAIASIDAEILLFTNGSSKVCTDLYRLKLDVYKSVAYDILRINKYSILRDEHKVYTQENRRSYDDLLKEVRINIASIERLWKKWPSKTKK